MTTNPHHGQQRKVVQRYWLAMVTALLAGLFLAYYWIAVTPIVPVTVPMAVGIGTLAVIWITFHMLLLLTGAAAMLLGGTRFATLVSCYVAWNMASLLAASAGVETARVTLKSLTSVTFGLLMIEPGGWLRLFGQTWVPRVPAELMAVLAGLILGSFVRRFATTRLSEQPSS